MPLDRAKRHGDVDGRRGGELDLVVGGVVTLLLGLSEPLAQDPGAAGDVGRGRRDVGCQDRSTVVVDQPAEEPFPAVLPRFDPARACSRAAARRPFRCSSGVSIVIVCLMSTGRWARVVE